MKISKLVLSSLLISIGSSWLTGIVVQKAEKQHFIENLFIYRSIPLLAHGNLVECTFRCAMEDECMSIFHNEASAECRGTYTGYDEGHSLLGYSVAGWNYYLIYDERCPGVTGYVYIGQLDSCFKLHLLNSSLRYPDYNPICTDEGGELMKIDSDKKQQYAAKFLDHFEFKQFNWIFFQGYHYTNEENWYYNNGSIMNYFNWHPSQPDSGTSRALEVVAMRKIDNYAWQDLWSHNYGAFLCERPILEF